MTFDPTLTIYISTDPTQTRFIFPTSIMEKYSKKIIVGTIIVHKIHIAFLQV